MSRFKYCRAPFAPGLSFPLFSPLRGCCDPAQVFNLRAILPGFSLAETPTWTALVHSKMATCRTRYSRYYSLFSELRVLKSPHPSELTILPRVMLVSPNSVPFQSNFHVAGSARSFRTKWSSAIERGARSSAIPHLGSQNFSVRRTPRATLLDRHILSPLRVSALLRQPVHQARHFVCSVSAIREFPSGKVGMAALKIDGTAIAKNIRESLKAEIQKAQESNPRFKPSLVIFQGK